MIEGHLTPEFLAYGLAPHRKPLGVSLAAAIEVCTGFSRSGLVGSRIGWNIGYECVGIEMDRIGLSLEGPVSDVKPGPHPT